jgi:hypothetical protein
MGQPPEVIEKQFPDFKEQVKRMQERVSKSEQRRIDILTGRRIGPEEEEDNDDER